MTRDAQKTMFAFGLLALSLLAAPAARAATEPTIENSFLFGSCIHLGYNGNQAYMSPQITQTRLTALGVTSTRDDLMWGVQQAASPLAFLPYMSHLSYSLTNIKAKSMLILVGDSTQIPEGEPTSDASRQKYAVYAGAAATSLKSVNPIFEMWNEWNLDKTASGTPQNYVALAKFAYPAVKKAAPNAIVLAGAVGNDSPNWAWTVAAVQAGVMNYADGLSVHIYNHCAAAANRTGTNAIASVVSLHNMLVAAAPKLNIPIYITEFGWPTEDGQCGGVSEANTANNIAQVLLWGPAFPWLKGVWLYELDDEGTDPSNREFHFGQFRTDGSAKPSVCSASTAWDFIANYSFESDRQPVEGVEKVSYSSGSSRHIAVWQTDPAAPARWLKIPIGATAVSLCDPTTVIKAGVGVQISQRPILITTTSAYESTIVVK